MKNIKFQYTSLILLLLMAFGCSEEFLEVTPQAADNSAAFYQNMTHADQAIIAAYSQFNNVAAWDRNLIMAYGEIASDDGEGGGDFVNEVPDFENVNRLIHDPTVEHFDATWGTFYRAINLANIALERLPSIAETDPDADIQLLNIRLAEAKFIRAINYFYLTIVFGEVPLVDHVIGPSLYTMGRSSLREIYDLIEQDLKEAMEVLPQKGEWNGEEGRATKGAAQALLARTYLYESSYAKHYSGANYAWYENLNERWGEALQYAEAVINSGKYELVGINGETYETWRSPETDGFRYIFTSEGDYSPEVVFEITCVQEGLGWNEARGHSLSNWTNARYYYTEDGRSVGTGYWGLGLPGTDLLAAFDEGDPRLRTSIAWEGCEDCPPIEIGGGGRYPISFENSVTKTYARKYESSAEEYKDVSGDWHAAPGNVKLIRYSDVYLIAAEAALMDGNNAKALEYVNKVRERARMCGDTGQPAALSSVTLDDIIHERRLEFAGEGHRMFDIVRWNKAYDLLNTPTEDGYVRNFVRGQHEYQPIPAREIELSQGNLKQYTGW
jgi:hypothetical protein